MGLFLLAALMALASPTFAQQPTNTSYLLLRMENYDVTASVSLPDHKVDVQTTLTVSNPSDRAVSQMEFKLGEKAQIASVTFNGSPVQFNTKTNERTRTLNVNFDTAQPIVPGQSAKVGFHYGVPVEEASAQAALNIDESVLLPESFWLPLIHTPYLVESNVDLTPFTLRVTAPAGMKAVSSGELVSETQQGDAITSVYHQTLFAQPWFIARDFQVAAGGDSRVEIYLPRDYALSHPQTNDRLRGEVKQVLDFYANFFGQPAPASIRLVASSAVPFYGAPGILILDERILARDVLDEDTAFFLASTLARNWLSGRFQIQGAGNAVLYDGLPGYLALLYLQQQYGQPVVDRVVQRFRNEYLRIVSGASAFDAPLARQSLLNREYYTSIYNKVPMVMRLIEKTMGRDKLLSVIKTLFSGPAGKSVTLEDFRNALLAAGDAEKLKTIFDQWFDRVILPNFAVGKPVQEKGKWSVTIANFGDGGGEIEVEIVTPTGERQRQQVKIGPEGYAQAGFDTPSEPVLARVDPDQIYLQAKYDDDVYPRKPPVAELIGQGTVALIQGKAEEAEAKLRQAVNGAPENFVAHAVLARALAALNRTDEAEREARQALKEPLPSLTAYANAQWALGEIALRRNQAAQAVGHFRQAALALAEDVSLLTAREALIRAETAADQLPKADGSVQQFISEFDAAVSTGRPAAVRELVELQNLKAFTVGVSFVKAWKTEILRAQRLDAHRLILDVRTQATANDRQRTARAVYILRQQGPSWKVYDIPVFVEK
jgi:tetratricopeptide (TPR) repeat protein